MKVKFNLPSKRYNSRIDFDNNTTFGFGNLQPLFSKFVLPKSKFSCNLNQLTRLSPLVVPTFARLKQINDFVYVNINKVFPAFDAFISQTPVNGYDKLYTPNSVPVTTNQYLFNCLLHYSYSISSRKLDDGNFSNGSHVVRVFDYLHPDSYTIPSLALTDELSSVQFKELISVADFVVEDSRSSTGSSNNIFAGKYTQEGRFWYNVLRGLGYSLDYYDTKPVSILPLWAFIKAYYDLYYPKRYNSWHSSNTYRQINNHYNGDFVDLSFEGHHYDAIKESPLCSLFGSGNSFYMFATQNDDIFQAALSSPLNSSVPNGAQYEEGLKTSGTDFLVQGDANVPSLNHDTTGSMSSLSADGLSLVNRLWSFVSRSSVVGQSVKDWFKVHFGINPSEDMFDTSVCFAQKPNFISINSVVSNSDTKSETSGARLGDLAGQALSSISDKVTFDVPNFGFIFCISGVIPLTRISGGTQPELYNSMYYEMPFPDFDGLGYESLNNSSIVDEGGMHKYDESQPLNQGYGYLPRFTSYKTLNNIRSGGFALRSIRDTYLSYCEDTIVNYNNGVPSSSSLKAFFPWRYSGSQFLSFDRIFYNQFITDPFFPKLRYIDDNFMCQTAFEFNISSYLKPISDSYSIESLGKQLVSVKRQ